MDSREEHEFPGSPESYDFKWDFAFLGLAFISWYLTWLLLFCSTFSIGVCVGEINPTWCSILRRQTKPKEDTKVTRQEHLEEPAFEQDGGSKLLRKWDAYDLARHLTAILSQDYRTGTAQSPEKKLAETLQTAIISFQSIYAVEQLKSKSLERGPGDALRPLGQSILPWMQYGDLPLPPKRLVPAIKPPLFKEHCKQGRNRAQVLEELFLMCKDVMDTPTPIPRDEKQKVVSDEDRIRILHCSETVARVLRLLDYLQKRNTQPSGVHNKSLLNK